VNQEREAREQGGEERAALLGASLANGLQYFRREDEALGCACVFAQSRTRVIGRHLKGIGDGLELIEPEGFNLCAFRRV